MSPVVKEKGKKKRSWAITDSPSSEDVEVLDYSKKKPAEAKGEVIFEIFCLFFFS